MSTGGLRLDLRNWRRFSARKAGDVVDRHVEREFQRPACARSLREQQAALQRGDHRRREILRLGLEPERAAIAHCPQTPDEMGFPQRKAVLEHCPRAFGTIRQFARQRSERATAYSAGGLVHGQFPVGHSAEVDAVAAATGAFVNANPRFLQPAGFVLAPDGTVRASVYATSAIGRMLAKDVVGFVGYLQSVAAKAAAAV